MSPPAGGRLPDFGSYHAVGVLGEGGMGIVYLAEQREPIRRRVALKVLKHGDDRPSFFARFESERQALAMMDHPNIARVYDAGATEDGRPYFAMEYVPGIPITEYCDRNLLGFRERLTLFQQVCWAVQHAHQKGIIHRDLKPSNVLVTLQDGRAVPKVIDFGVAKAVNQRLTERTLFTETGMLVGTPEYMSPEQADLTGLDVDTTTDVYSLGVLLYELLVGALPFDSKALRRAGYAEIQRVIREEEPPRPTMRLSSLGQTAAEVARHRSSDVRTLIRLLRGDLEWITMKALEKDRTHRYPSASEFAADIGRHLANEPVSASPPSVAYRLQKLIQRHRGQVAAAAALALALLIGLIASSALYIRANRAREATEWQAYKSSLAAARSEIDSFRSESARRLLRSVPQTLRGWEWKYLYRLSDTRLATLKIGEPLAITASGRQYHTVGQIAFSRDGTRVLAFTNSSVHAWELGTFRRTGDYGPFGQILTMSRDGSKVVCRSRSQPYTLEIIETFTGELLAVLQGNGREVVNAALSAEASRVATLAEDGEIWIWDARTGKDQIRIRGSAPNREMVDHDSIALSPDGRQLLSSERERIILWDAVTGRKVLTLEGHVVPVEFLTFNHDGTRILSAGMSVRLWDSLTGKRLAAWPFSGAGIFQTVAENPDGTQVAGASTYGPLEIWDLTEGQEVGKLTGRDLGTSVALSYSPDGKYLIDESALGEVRIWDASTLGGRAVRPPGISQYGPPDELGVSASTESEIDRPSAFHLTRTSLSSDGTRMAVPNGRNIAVLDTTDWKTVKVWKGGHSEAVLAVAYHPGDAMVASGSKDKTICIWSMASSVPLRCLQGHQSPVGTLEYSHDGAQLISGADDGTVRLWDAHTGNNRLTREFHGQVADTAISPDGRTLAVNVLGGKQAGVNLMDLVTGVVLPPLKGVSRVPDILGALAFGGGGAWLVTGDPTTIWDISTRKVLSTPPVSVTTPCSHAISPDGKRLVTSSSDQNSSIWRPTTGETVLTLYQTGCEHLQFSPDGSRLYGSQPGNIDIYDTRLPIPPEADELLESLKKRFPLYSELRNFLRADRQLDPTLRDTVLRIIEGIPEDDNVVDRLVQTVLDLPDAGDPAYQQALRRSRAIAEMTPWSMPNLARIGMAQYRVREYAGALATLQRSEIKSPESLLFLAMAHHHLGHATDARQNLETGRAIAGKISGPDETTAPLRALLHEAESLIEASAPK
jgi:WD40 repeat protein/serine/threonine protein kinase